MMPNIMKRSSRLFLFFLFGSAFLSAGTTASAEGLYDRYSRAAEVKVFVAQPKEVGVTGQVDPAALKQALEKGLIERKSIRFKTVPSAEEATLTVETDIQGFYFTEHDPVDMLVGVGMAAMDAAKQDHFARLEADFRVVESKSGQVLYKDRLTASLTDEKMTEAESKIKILERASDVFVRSAFGRAKRKR